jgi:SAM-dependent methyltransferase
VLDVGCGTGYTLSRLPAGVRATGIDLSPTSVALARERAPGASIVQGSATALPFGDGTFDACIALDVLEHIDDDLGAARELRRVVRPGGVVLITVPALKLLWHAHDEALHHRRRYTLGEIVATTERAGLRVETQTYYNSLLFPLVLAQRVGGRLLGLAKDGDSDLRIPPAPLNRALGAILSAERHLVRYVRLPIGVSCLVVARG